MRTQRFRVLGLALLSTVTVLAACAADGVDVHIASSALTTPADVQASASGTSVRASLPSLPEGCLHPTFCPSPSQSWSRDLIATDLHLDLARLHGSAVITFVPSLSSTGASFDVHGLVVESVTGPYGPLDYRVDGGRLDVGVPLGTVYVSVDYAFTVHDDFDGWLPQGVSFLWPRFCGNLFPCKPDPDDGLAFSLDVTGVPEGQTAVYPTVIPFNAPSYQPAIAVGNYVKRVLGATPAGTQLSVWFHPGEEAAAERGTLHLVDGFAFFEQVLGPYVFGQEAGTVSASWGPGGYGGMEHHPFWHVGGPSLASGLTNLHEAAHGWFGDGVRMQCWEDFVLSEGSADYWSARAYEATYGTAGGKLVWDYYRRVLDSVMAAGGDTIAWPSGCNAIDILHDPLWSSIPYKKGAFFLRAVEERVGRDAFDRAVSLFYMWHVGKAASMQDLVDTIEWMTGTQVDDLVQVWLRQLGAPAAAP